MRWVLLAASLLLILGAAVAYSLWEPAPELPPHHEPVAAPPIAALPPRPLTEAPARPLEPVAAQPSLAPAWVPQPAPPPPPPLPDQPPMVGFDEEVEPPDSGRVELTTAAAQGVLRSKMQDLQRCYLAWAEAKGDAAPRRLVYTFVIEGTADQQAGAISKVEVSGASDAADLETCAREVTKGITFDPPRGPVRVPLPFAAWSGHAVKLEMSHGLER